MADSKYNIACECECECECDENIRKQTTRNIIKATAAEFGAGKRGSNKVERISLSNIQYVKVLSLQNTNQLRRIFRTRPDQRHLVMLLLLSMMCNILIWANRPILRTRPDQRPSACLSSSASSISLSTENNALACRPKR
jgi:hypothetical protein